MQNLQLFEYFKGNFSIFWKNLQKFYRKFPEHLGKYLENFGNMHF